MRKKLRSMLRFAPWVICALAFAMPASGQQPAVREKLVFFFSQTCHNCHEVKDGIVSMVARDHRGRIDIEYRDIGDIDSYKLLLGFREKLGLTGQIQVPAVYFCGELLIGQDTIENTLLDLIGRQGVTAQVSAPAEQIPPVDLVGHFRSFTPAAVIGAGLIDGINPCAFTVMVFFISFLSLQGYRRRELLVIGSAFIISVFLTYLLLGLGLFNFFYSIKGVFVVRRALNLGIGLFTLALGIAAVRDIARFIRTGSTDNMILALPSAVKNRIHKVIGLAYRKDPASGRHEKNVSVARLCIAAFVTGFLVSLLEAVCTGQVYLPTITFVLRSAEVRLQAAGYLVLYNIMFIVPLAVIFVFALAGVSSGQFTKFLHRHFLAVKILMACLFFMFALFLLWRG